MVRDVERTVKNFMNGNRGGVLGSNLLWAFFLSLVPSWSLTIFIVFKADLETFFLKTH